MFRPTLRKHVVTAPIFTYSSKLIQRKPQNRWRGRRPRHLFCGGGQRPPPLYIGFESSEYGSRHYHICLACRCAWTSYSSPLRLHVPSPFVRLRHGPIYFRKLTRKGNICPTYFALPPGKWIGPPRPTFGDGVVIETMQQLILPCGLPTYWCSLRPAKVLCSTKHCCLRRTCDALFKAPSPIVPLVLP